MTGKKWILAAPAAVALVISVGVFLGWETAGGLFMASGTVLGVTFGAFIGNRKARKVDIYREEWLSKRAKRKQPPPSE